MEVIYYKQGDNEKMDMSTWIKKNNITTKEIKQRVISLKDKHKQRGLSEAEAQAKAEMELLKPKKLADLEYLGNKTNFYNTVTFYFKTKKEFDLVAKYFKLSDYLGYNTHDTELLITLLEKIESGEIVI